ncbi:SUMF1/EgtB/PvdO family nonheme iron enzyme [Alcanivorax sp.]|uniref:SUMF1/EgtB/PvdO family nonheme iron enzyme n=1 Tax=Alcanivorax sp. TaxID=1872427 RepID=UPI00343F9CE3
MAHWITVTCQLSRGGIPLAPGTLRYLSTHPLGMYDMTGNVAEWVLDWHDKNYYETSRG